MSDYAIDVTGLTKKFALRLAVDHIDLRVPKGSIFGFLGANGSGKTTTLRMLCGLLTPTDGQGQCLGYNILNQSDAIKRETGYMPQQFSFYNGLSVEQNLRFMADIFDMDDVEQKIDQVINDFDLEPYRDIRAANLSGGWKQRLSLACCVLHEPKLLFLDEPTAGIDPKARKEFWDYLHKLVRDRGTTILVTTHYMDEAEKCTQLAYIYLGKLLYSGDTKDLIPYSQVETYLLDAPASEQSRLINYIQERYPGVMVSLVNNELRISSREAKELARVIEVEKYKVKKVSPSFEEVFIGLIQ